MENIDWATVIAVSLAIGIFVGGLLMMFTGVWTMKNK